MKKLILFTTSYPFGNHETYIEDELLVLSKNFNVEIYPLIYKKKSKVPRRVPMNVRVHSPAFPISKLQRVILFFRGLVHVGNLNVIFHDFADFKVYKNPINLKTWFMHYFHYVAMLGTSQYHDVELLDNCVFYFYWGNGWPMLCLNLAKRRNRKIFIRLHGSDCYLDRNSGYLPVRSFLYSFADYILPISENIKNYIISLYQVDSSKILVSPLGVRKVESVNVDWPCPSGRVTIVSCSNIIKLKRLDLIIKALQLLDGDCVLDWVHFGSGDDEKRIKRILNDYSFSTIIIQFRGHCQREEIYDYYKKNYIHGFLNVSEHEGVPVSIMEAMSFGIPCIATDVGATRELVNNNNGILISKDFAVSELAALIKESISDNSWVVKRLVSYNFCNENFNSETNAKRLTLFLQH